MAAKVKCERKTHLNKMRVSKQNGCEEVDLLQGQSISGLSKNKMKVRRRKGFNPI